MHHEMGLEDRVPKLVEIRGCVGLEVKVVLGGAVPWLRNHAWKSMPDGMMAGL